MLTLITGDGVAPPRFGPRIGTVVRPPMGWDSWNTFGCDIDETKILSAARAMASSGMRAAGYRYVIVDDCWQAPARAADGTLVAGPARFPHGMVYQAPREQTCAEYTATMPGATGATGHERQDARTFAAWGVDPNSAHDDTGPLYDWGQVADMWRTTEDISDVWHTGCPPGCPAGGAMGITDILDAQAPLWRDAGPGRWNDPDMLEVGVRDTFTPTENRAHLAMWAMMAAPLIAGNDVTTMSTDVRAVLTDPEVIALDQDPSGRQARRLRGDGQTEVWGAPPRGRIGRGRVAQSLRRHGGGRDISDGGAGAAHSTLCLVRPVGEAHDPHDREHLRAGAAAWGHALSHPPGALIA